MRANKVKNSMGWRANSRTPEYLLPSMSYAKQPLKVIGELNKNKKKFELIL